MNVGDKPYIFLPYCWLQYGFLSYTDGLPIVVHIFQDQEPDLGVRQMDQTRRQNPF